MTHQIKLRFQPEDSNTASFANMAIRDRLVKELVKLPKGNELLQDALEKGDITLNLTREAVAGNAHWDMYTRTVNIHIDFSRSDFYVCEAKREKLFQTTLFELCNAANPLLNNTTVSDGPIFYRDAEAFARASERKEFKSYQRFAEIVNAAVDAKLSGWAQDDRVPAYTDAEFDKFFTDIADKEMPEYGAQKTHANYYRQGWENRVGSLSQSRASADATASPIKAEANPQGEPSWRQIIAQRKAEMAQRVLEAQKANLQAQLALSRAVLSKTSDDSANSSQTKAEASSQSEPSWRRVMAEHRAEMNQRFEANEARQEALLAQFKARLSKITNDSAEQNNATLAKLESNLATHKSTIEMAVAKVSRR